MTEIYLNCSDTQIEDIINEKMKIYPDNLSIWKRNKIELSNNFFVLQYYTEFNSLDIKEYQIFRYVAKYDGIELYNFYNIVKI